MTTNHTQFTEIHKDDFDLINEITHLRQSHRQLLSALTLIRDSEPLESGTFVCDMQTLQGIANAAIEKATHDHD